jgi:hypothetical protein
MYAPPSVGNDGNVTKEHCEDVNMPFASQGPGGAPFGPMSSPYAYQLPTMGGFNSVTSTYPVIVGVSGTLLQPPPLLLELALLAPAPLLPLAPDPLPLEPARLLLAPLLAPDPLLVLARLLLPPPLLELPALPLLPPPLLELPALPLLPLLSPPLLPLPLLAPPPPAGRSPRLPVPSTASQPPAT